MHVVLQLQCISLNTSVSKLMITKALTPRLQLTPVTIQNLGQDNLEL